jgi:hypothetical protein
LRRYQRSSNAGALPFTYPNDRNYTVIEAHHERVFPVEVGPGPPCTTYPQLPKEWPANEVFAEPEDVEAVVGRAQIAKPLTSAGDGKTLAPVVAVHSGAKIFGVLEQFESPTRRPHRTCPRSPRRGVPTDDPHGAAARGSGADARTQQPCTAGGSRGKSESENSPWNSSSIRDTSRWPRIAWCSPSPFGPTVQW